MNYTQLLAERIKNRQFRSLIDVNTLLEHLAIITYRVPAERVAKFIPKPFKLFTFVENGTEFALISAVPFKDKDFAFYRISKQINFSFYQTNFRTYIIDQRNNEHCAWFFGTTLGSYTALIPRYLWQMPWQKGTYKFSCKLTEAGYQQYNMKFSSKQGKGLVEIVSGTEPMKLLPGFDTLEQQILILTHPTIGYYNISDKKLGMYEIWHPEMKLYSGISQNLYFEIFEKLGLLTQSEMQNPHSVLITPSIEFDILLPPRKIRI